MERDLKDILSSLPEKPGVYRFYDKNEKLLYVGKAKNIKKRVNSYFIKEHASGRIILLVKNIDYIKFTVVENERDAFLLENNFIKNEQPKYNIQLKDDKTYPYIAVRKEKFPRVYFTRKKINDGSEYFGPYTSVFYARKALEVIFKLFPLRTCKLNLSKENIAKNKFKVCLEYHIGNCLGPCENHQSEEEYNQSIQQVRNILGGNLKIVETHLEEKINKCAQVLQFEKAHDYTKRLNALNQYNKRNTIANTGTRNIDVYHILKVEKKFFIQFMKVKNGAIISAKLIEVKSKLDESEAEVLKYVIEKQLNELTEKELPNEIITPLELNHEVVKISVPKQGERKKILDLAFRNLIAQKQHYLDFKSKSDKNTSTRVLETLQKDLKLRELPVHIEGFDNSNIQGTNPVASLVVFKNGKPAKKEYRHYKIKTVDGPNDFASMEEVVFRRYSKLKKEGLPLPNLIVVDGGKGQLSSAIKSLKKINLYKEIPIIGIAKRLEEIYFPEDSYPIYINKKSESLKLIQHIRNETHRFAINFHRDLRSKDFTKSSLENIKGIGKKTAELLLREFKSTEKIKRATFEELALFIGPKKAKLVEENLKD